MTLVKHTIDIEHETPPETTWIPYTPEPAIERCWSDSRAYVVFKWQFFAHMIYDGMKMVHTRSVPLAATDSVNILLNHDGLENMGINTIPQRVFVMAHEVGHRVFNDLVMAIIWRQTKQVSLGGGRWLPYDHEIMNMAQDYRINAMLVNAKVGQMPECALYDENISKMGMETCVEIYEKIYQEETEKRKRAGDRWVPYGPGGGGKGFDQHIEPTKQQVQADRVRREQQIIAAAEIALRTQGTIPGAMQLLINEILHPKVAWEQHLRSTMTRKAGEPKLDWRFRNRRLAGRTPDPMFYAKVGHKGCGIIGVGYDTSGSCVDPKVQQRFFSEMAGIAKDLNPEKMVIIWCDATVQRVDDLDSPTDLTELRNEINKAGGAPGGGGTDFRPIFEYVEKHQLKPDMLIVLTDTYGTFPESAPGFPVIWCSIGGKTKVPFGELIHVEL